MNRRGIHAIAFLCAVALGLASRRYPGLFPAFLGKYPGDSLWALMVFFICGFVMPGASTPKLALTALAISFADECSQLYQAPWLNGIRHTTLGHLVLGASFSWFDMAAYPVGVAIGAVCNDALHRLFPKSSADFPLTKSHQTNLG